MTHQGQMILIMSVTASAVSDLCSGRIYNFVVFPAMIAGIGTAAVEKPHSLPLIAAVILITYLFLIPFWKAGGIGAGDIKLLAAIVPFMGVSWYLTCFAMSFLIAAVFSLGLLLMSRNFKRRVHLAVPIGISVMLCLLLQQFGIQSPIRF